MYVYIKVWRPQWNMGCIISLAFIHYHLYYIYHLTIDNDKFSVSCAITSFNMRLHQDKFLISSILYENLEPVTITLITQILWQMFQQLTSLRRAFLRQEWSYSFHVQERWHLQNCLSCLQLWCGIARMFPVIEEQPRKYLGKVTLSFAIREVDPKAFCNVRKQE